MSAAGLSKARLGRLADVMRGYVERGEVAGVVTLLCRHDEVHVEAIGNQDLAAATPMRRDTIFRIASISVRFLLGLLDVGLPGRRRLSRRRNMANTADREIVTTRVVDAPRERVWTAWTDREQVAQWWGPNGFTNTIHEMDLRPGGVWRFVMHGPDSTDYKNKIIYEEIVKPERLSYLHESAPKFHATATFDEDGGKTTVTLRSLFDTAKERDRTVKVFGAVEGAKQMLGRLAEHVARIKG